MRPLHDDRFGTRDPHQIAQRILEVMPWARRLRVSDEFLHRVGVATSIETAMNNLLVEMRKDLWVDRVLDEEQRVPVVGRVCTFAVPRSVLVELPRTWWQRLTRRPATTRWCPVVGDAAISDPDDTIDVYGSAVVRAEFYATFPEPTIRYPEGLGPGRRLVVPIRREPEAVVAMRAAAPTEPVSFGAMCQLIAGGLEAEESATWRGREECEIRLGPRAWIDAVTACAGSGRVGTGTDHILGVPVVKDFALRPQEWRLVVARTRALLVAGELSP